MGRNKRGIKDGTGSYKYSYRKKVLKKSIGTKQEEGEDCPFDLNKKESFKW